MNKLVSHITLSRQTTYCRHLCFLFLFFLVQSHLKAQIAEATPERTKADFLFHFTQFIQWPQEAFPDAHAPLVIGIVGTDLFGAYLDQIVTRQTASGRPIAVHRFTDDAEIENCHLLFINKPVSSDTLTLLHNRNMVTVSDGSDFIESGGMIRFFTEQNKTGFEVNLAAVRVARVEISSKLLRMAKVIEK